MGYYTTYYTFGLPTFLVLVIALYLLFTGRLEYGVYGVVIGLPYAAQTRERLLTLEGFWRNQVRMSGRRLALVFALV